MAVCWLNSCSSVSVYDSNSSFAAFNGSKDLLEKLFKAALRISAAKSEILLVSGFKPSPLFLALVIFVEERLSSSESEVISCRLRFFRDRALPGL